MQGFRSGSRRGQDQASSRGWQISIGLKIGCGFLAAVLLLAGSGVWAYLTVGTLDARYAELQTRTVPLALAALELNAEVQKQAQLIMAIAATRDLDRSQNLKNSRQKSEALLAYLQQEASANPAWASRIQAMTEQKQRLDGKVDAVLRQAADYANTMVYLEADNARALGEVLGQQTNGLVGELRQHMEDARRSARVEVTRAVGFLGAVVLMSIVAAGGIGWLVFRAIAHPLRAVTAQLSSIAAGAGDLTRHVEVASRDELGLLAASFNRMLTTLSVMVRKVVATSLDTRDKAQHMRTVTNGVLEAIGTVAGAADQVACSAEQQASQSTDATSVMEELNQAISQIAVGAQEQARRAQQAGQLVEEMVQALSHMAEDSTMVERLSAEAADTARRSAEIVDATLAGMARMRTHVLAISDQILELGSYGSRIGEIMNVITDIVEQTNLLALNAAIEAARAGAAGRGFAVVAEEVRRLAARATASSKEIEALIRNIQKGTTQAVKAIQGGRNEVESSARLTADAGNTLAAIVAAGQRTFDGVGRISASAQQVLGAAREVSKVVGDVAAIAQQNSAATEEMAAGAAQVHESLRTASRFAAGNSASAHAMAAAVAEVRGSMATIAQGAERLAALAEDLNALVVQFKVN